jgi:hypothetical protein
MPGGFPIGFSVSNGQSVGANLAASLGTAVAGNASANVVGAYAQLIASAASDATWAVVCLTGFNVNGDAALVDIAIGAGGSEKIILQQLSCGGGASLSSSGRAQYAFPVQIPSGSRVSARCQIDTAGDTLWANCQLFDGDFTQIEGCAGVDSIGVDTTSSKGTAIDPGAVANTKGSYVQLVASTARDYMGLTIVTDRGAGGNLGGNSIFDWLIDVAVGAAGAEKIIIPDYHAGTYANTALAANPTFVPINIPSGTRIAARSQTTGITSPNRLIGVMLYGLYQ